MCLSICLSLEVVQASLSYLETLRSDFSMGVGFSLCFFVEARRWQIQNQSPFFKKSNRRHKATSNRISCRLLASKMSSNSNPPLSYCIVWSPLPPITWLCPVIGHLGIANSRGIASDFRGPYFVGDDGRLAFGPATRVLCIPNVDADVWDEAIREANSVYSQRMHNICCDNCHSHVAYALNHMQVKAYGVEKWDMVKLALLMFVRGKFLSGKAVLAQFGPFVILLLVIVLSTRLTR